MYSIVRDGYGIPHIEADDLDGLFRAQGFACAQDRLWQMEWDRRRALGRVSELVGPGGLEIDRFARGLRIAGAAREGLARVDDRTRSMLESYAAGVNDALHAGVRAVELERLGAPPEPWEAWHPIAAFLVRHVAFGAAWVTKLYRARVLLQLGVDAALSFRREGPPGIVVPSIAAGDVVVPRPDVDVTPSLEALSLLGEVPEIDAADPDASNAWAVSASRTRSGLPLVAGDPHRALEAPNVYMQVYLRTPGVDVAGLAFAGVPGVPHFGHCGSVAWCVTNAAADTDDVFVEKLGSITDRREETIAVRGADPVAIETAMTRHGPVIAESGGAALALCSAGLRSPGLGFGAIVPLLLARTSGDVEAALRDWVDPVNNWVIADRAGISYRTAGHIPLRSEVNRWLPVPGWTGAHEWAGVRAFESMPAMRDPDDGLIVTANQRICEDTTISPDYAPPGRTIRLRERLRDADDATVESMAAVHLDDVTVAGLAFARGVPELASWDGRMHRDSRGAAVYAAIRDALARLRAERLVPLLPPVDGAPPGTVPAVARLAQYARDWPMPPGELEQARRAASPDRWGDVHRSRHLHALARLAPDVASPATPPGIEVDGDGECVVATLSHPGVTFEAVSGPVARYVFEIGDRPSGAWIVPLGASGDPASPHFADQQEAWSHGGLIAITP